MTNYRRQPTPKPGDCMYAIRRSQNTVKTGWLISLSYYEGRPSFVCEVYDSVWDNDCEKSLYRAIIVRDENLHLVTEREDYNYVPVRRVYREKGRGWYAQRTRPSGAIDKRYFGDNGYGGRRESFIAAVKFRQEDEIKNYGVASTMLDQSLEALDQYPD